MKIQSTNVSQTESVNLSSIVGYLKFASPNKTRSLLTIALHNFGLAFMAYILSLFSSGVLGVFSLCSSFFIGGVTIATIPKNFYNISFVILELIGMSLAVFGGIFFKKKRNINFWSLEKISIFSFIMMAVLLSIYVFAAYIESNLLQSLWE